jgi:phosphatidylglycerophosphate synthase
VAVKGGAKVLMHAPREATDPPGAAFVRRRPLRSRQTRWARALAGWLARRDVSPNHISLASIAFAAAAGLALAGSGPAGTELRGVLLVAAAAGIQLRLLCNLLDGMVAVEGGRRTPRGEIYNEVPDRLADVLILVGAGYAAAAWLPWAGTLGWAAALLAILTAYVRVLGASVGTQHYFVGPMAKQQRMALLTAACLLAVVEPTLGEVGRVLAGALLLILAGSAVTTARRVARIVRDLETGRVRGAGEG